MWEEPRPKGSYGWDVTRPVRVNSLEAPSGSPPSLATCNTTRAMDSPIWSDPRPKTHVRVSGPVRVSDPVRVRLTLAEPVHSSYIYTHCPHFLPLVKPEETCSDSCPQFYSKPWRTKVLLLFCLETPTRMIPIQAYSFSAQVPVTVSFCDFLLGLVSPFDLRVGFAPRARII
jgi:hypothetical protein